MQGAQVQSLAGELRSHMLCNVAKKIKKKTKTKNLSLLPERLWTDV